MEYKIKPQRGYLYIMAVILIVVVGLISSMLAYLFLGKTLTSSGTGQSNQAYYVAQAGLELAKRAIINSNNCSSINGLAAYTNASILNGAGQFTATGTPSNGTSTLSGNITNSSSSITLNNASTFASQGIALIESEQISYNSIDVNTLQNVARGINGTAAVAHNFNTPVNQNQCLISSTGGVPTLAAPAGRRILQQILPAQTFSLPGVSTTALASFGNVILSGTPFIINPAARLLGSTYTGNTIVTRGSVTISGNGGTKINSDSGLVQSSSRTGILGDVIQNYDVDSTADFFALFFNQTLSQLNSQAGSIGSGGITISGSGNTQSIADSGGMILKLNGNVTISGGNNTLNLAAGATTPRVVIINGDLTVSGGNNHINVGNPTSGVPAILIVTGDFVDSGGNNSTNFYGLVYVGDNLTLSGASGLAGNGMFAVEGRTTFSGAGTMSFDPGILSKLSLPGLHTSTSFSTTQAITSEFFQ